MSSEEVTKLIKFHGAAYNCDTLQSTEPSDTADESTATVSSLLSYYTNKHKHNNKQLLSSFQAELMHSLLLTWPHC